MRLTKWLIKENAEYEMLKAFSDGTGTPLAKLITEEFEPLQALSFYINMIKIPLETKIVSNGIFIVFIQKKRPRRASIPGII